MKINQTRRSSSPSAHDVAHLAGVSQASVSRAFTPGASIAEATRTRILAAADTLGYRPNLMARSLIKGESSIVGVVIGNMRDSVTTTALDILLRQLADGGKHILMFTAEEAAHADRQVEDLLKYRVDALVLMATSISPHLAERCHSENITVVFFNRQMGRIKKFMSVFGDNRAGAGKIAQHLVEQGYKRLAMIAGFKGSSTNHDREAGFTRYLAKQGLPPPLIEIGLCQREAAMDATRRLLSAGQRPDAIFCVNDHMALAALEVSRYEFGLEPGVDIGIAGFDDIDQAAWPSFDLTTYSYPVESMANTIAETLLLRPEKTGPLQTVIEGSLQVRRSTCRTTRS